MNRPHIRDPRRIARRFRLTSKRGFVGQSLVGTTTWPMLAKDESDKQKINPSIHVAAIITKRGKKTLVTNGA